MDAGRRGRGLLRRVFLSRNPAPFATAISWLSQNALCLRALAWNETTRACSERMGALSQLPFTLSGGIERELKESVWLQISTAQGSMLRTLTRARSGGARRGESSALNTAEDHYALWFYWIVPHFSQGRKKIISSRLLLRWLVCDWGVRGCLVCKWGRVWISD